MKEEHREAALKLRAAQLKEGHSLNSRKSYRGWMIRYRDARLEKRCRDVQGFLDLLIHGEKYVAPPTIHQAVNALVFYHKHVLGRPIPPESLKFPRRSRHKNHRDCPTHQEVMDIFSHLRGLPLLQAEMLYGTSSRITALLTLRMKDLDLVRGNVSFRFDKGGKSRTLPLPRTLLPKLHAHIAVMRQQWAEDRERGVICPLDPPSLARKIGRNKLGTLPWYWLFPSQKVHGDERWFDPVSSHHLDSQRVLASGVPQRVTHARFGGPLESRGKGVAA